jgi:hypothetical protein
MAIAKKKTTPKNLPKPTYMGGGGGGAAAAAGAVGKVVKNNVKKVKTSKKGSTPKESDISYALRHGRITKEEAAALDPKKFKILLDDSKTRRFNFNTKKYEPKKK